MTILAALQAFLIWWAALYSTNIDAHPVPDPPAVTDGVQAPTARHQPPPAPTAPAPVAPAPVELGPATDSPMCPDPEVAEDGCWALDGWNTGSAALVAPPG